MNRPLRPRPALIALLLCVWPTIPEYVAAAEPDFNGTAYLKLRRVTVFDGQDIGPQRNAIMALVAACNNVRSGFYQLPAVQPQESLLADLDTQIVEKYFANDRAATYVTGSVLDLTDYVRWMRESRGPAKPAAPPDCAAATSHQNRSATLWVDGVKYQLRFDSRSSLRQPPGVDFTARSLLPRPAFEQLPRNDVAGQECREVSAPPLLEFMGGRACIWTAFPYAAWLNFPWALRSERSFGMPRKLRQTDTALAVERNRRVDAKVFRSPEDFRTPGR